MKITEKCFKFLNFSAAVLWFALSVWLLILVFQIDFSKSEKEESVQPKIVINYPEYLCDDYQDLEAIRFFTRWKAEPVSLDDALLIVRTINKHNDTVLNTIDILSIIALESNFVPNAVNPGSKDYGIAQINERTYFHFCKDDCKIENLFDIEYNIKMMLKVLKSKENRLRSKSINDYLLRKYLIMSYNRGVGGFLGSYFLRGEDSYYLELIELRRRGVLNWINRS